MEQALRQQVQGLERRLKEVWGLYQEELRINKMYEAKLAALVNDPSESRTDRSHSRSNERKNELDSASSPTDSNSEGRDNESGSASQKEAEETMHERGLDGFDTGVQSRMKSDKAHSPLVIESSVPPEVDLFVEPSQLPPWHPITQVQHETDKGKRVAEITPQQPKRFTGQAIPRPHEPALASPDLLFDRGAASPIEPKQGAEGDGKIHGNGNESVVEGKQTPGTTQKDNAMTLVSPRIVSDGISSPDLLVSDKGGASGSPSPVVMRALVEEAEEKQRGPESKRAKVDEKPHDVAKFQDVVRNRAERAALPGFCCEECRKFYEGLTLREGEDMQAVMNRFSRHRHQHAQPATPDGYWDMWSLPDESAPPTPKFKPAILGLFRPHQAASGNGQGTHGATSTVTVSKAASPMRPQPQSNGPS